MMDLLAFGTLPCVFHHSHQYYLWCVFSDGADDTLVMHRPVCTTQMHAADKMAMSRCWRCALPLKTVYFCVCSLDRMIVITSVLNIPWWLLATTLPAS